MKSQVKEGSICTFCNIGRVATGENTFIYEKHGQAMWIEHTPALVCGGCHEPYYSEAISSELVQKTEAMFTKSSGFLFIYQFNDFIRPGKTVQTFETFDRVRIHDGVDTWDMYDEDLEPGMEGTVLDKGENPFDWVVEFRLGRGRENIIQVEIDADDLELVQRIGEPAVKRKKAKSSR